MNNVLVSRKGQITIPISFRRKYGIKQGTTMTVQDSGSSIIIQVLPRFEDLAGIDAGKMSGEKAKKMLDKMRSEDRYWLRTVQENDKAGAIIAATAIATSCDYIITDDKHIKQIKETKTKWIS